MNPCFFPQSASSSICVRHCGRWDVYWWLKKRLSPSVAACSVFANSVISHKSLTALKMSSIGSLMLLFIIVVSSYFVCNSDLLILPYVLNKWSLIMRISAGNYPMILFLMALVYLLSIAFCTNAISDRCRSTYVWCSRRAVSYCVFAIMIWYWVAVGLMTRALGATGGTNGVPGATVLSWAALTSIPK